ncbi:alpha/beta fold hydrolase [Labrys neptuniae]
MRGTPTLGRLAFAGMLMLTATLPQLALAQGAAPAQAKAEIVTNDKVSIEVLVEGTGPTIVILPSQGRDGYADYDQVAKALAADGFKVLRPQPRGIGKSTGPMKGVGLYDFAQDVANVIDTLGGGRAVVVGHAYGHFVARMVATRYPERVRGVVVAAASASDTADRNPLVWWAPDFAGNTSLPDEQRLAALKGAFFARGSDPTGWLKGWYPQVTAMQTENPVPRKIWWAAGQAPILELIPEEDPFKPRDRWDELRKQLGDRVTTVTIPKASHALMPEQPAAVAKAIADWAQKLPK